MKKIIIPLAAAVIAVGTAGFILAHSNKAVADNPETPIELKDGSYYVDGDPANNDLYVIVENGTIRYATDLSNMREAFTRAVEADEEMVFETEEGFEAQIDYFMSDCGGTYTYSLKEWPDGERAFLRMISEADEHENEPHMHTSFLYYLHTNTIHSWEGDFVLYEEAPDISDETPADSTDANDVNAEPEAEA